MVILTGAGGNFSAGADISEFPAARTQSRGAYSEAGRAATLAIRDLPQPTIAAAHGYCVGGGCGLALACDLRVGDATTQMGIPAAKRGIVYSVLDTEHLMRAVGLSRAKLVLFSGRVFPMAECRAMGLLDEVRKRARWKARALAREMAERAPLSQRGAKITLAAIARGEVAARQPRSPRRSASPPAARIIARRPSLSGEAPAGVPGPLMDAAALAPGSSAIRPSPRPASAAPRWLRGLETLWFNTGTLCNVTCRNCYIESSPRNDRLAYLTRDEVRASGRDRADGCRCGWSASPAASRS